MTTAANHFVCHCKKGWAGNVCERPPTACYQKDCGHGKCILAGKDAATASCECQLDWTGTDCQTPICPSNKKVKNFYQQFLLQLLEMVVQH